MPYDLPQRQLFKISGDVEDSEELNFDTSFATEYETKGKQGQVLPFAPIMESIVQHNCPLENYGRFAHGTTYSAL